MQEFFPPGPVPVPGVIMQVFVALVVLVALRSIGDRVQNRERGDGRQGPLLDTLNILTAASLVAAITALPRFDDWASAFSNGTPGWASGIGAILFGGGLFWVGSQYFKKEKWSYLWIFALLLQIVALIWPPLNTALNWWNDYPVSAVWNFLVFLLTLVTGAS